ncbi:hypothetical protein AZA_32256 [Nitrospirillum viridazoti Y2]|uniref:Uncharacterized protein n=1 Tax=Nitrospirillum amazonense TaxID=28077 RepID=A0A560IDM4_9PROT|nr:hypothetical protein [Nitrospirillum amazonense]EGY02530.1 hypothetical protein AZA_32256 [Nitrospirillum amazonense Y2]TWB56119.1 hypothetical protein FBZ92_113113 [Nitrospirillum amazonense]
MGFILIAAAVILIGGMGAWYAHARMGRIELVKDTYCPVAGPSSITTVVIDRTDKLAPVQRSLLEARFEEVRKAIPKFGLLEVYTIGPVETDVLKPTFSLCNPGDGSDLSEVDANPARVRKKWEKGFDQPLRDVLDHLLTSDEAAASPIMESIQSVAATAFAKHIDGSKTLILVSDLLQFSPNLNQYKNPIAFTDFRKAAGYRKVKADLSGVDVRLFYVRRETGKGVQGAKHIEFWQEYFSDQGAVVSNILPLYGDV